MSAQAKAKKTSLEEHAKLTPVKPLTLLAQLLRLGCDRRRVILELLQLLTNALLQKFVVLSTSFVVATTALQPVHMQTLWWQGPCCCMMNVVYAGEKTAPMHSSDCRVSPHVQISLH